MHILAKPIFSLLKVNKQSFLSEGLHRDSWRTKKANFRFFSILVNDSQYQPRVRRRFEDCLTAEARAAAYFTLRPSNTVQKITSIRWRGRRTNKQTYFRCIILVKINILFKPTVVRTDCIGHNGSANEKIPRVRFPPY